MIAQNEAHFTESRPHIYNGHFDLYRSFIRFAQMYG